MLPRSSGAVVVLQQPAEASLAADLIEARDRRRRIVAFLRVDQPIADPLMRTAVMVVGDELADDVIEVLQPEDDEVVGGPRA